MIKDKIKIRISSFALVILENDCQAFNFINRNNDPNKNALLNKLIPNLVEFKKNRRQKIEEVLKSYNHNYAEEIYNAVNMVIDEVYFADEELNDKSETLWIRPHNDCVKVFDEINENETLITALDFSSYLRALINEYARLPQFKREQLLFHNELDLYHYAIREKRIIHFGYKKERYRIYVYVDMYGYAYDQANYLIGYDTKRNQIRSFDICYIENAYLIKQKFKTNEELENALQEYLNDYDYSDNNIVDYKGGI